MSDPAQVAWCDLDLPSECILFRNSPLSISRVSSVINNTYGHSPAAPYQSSAVDSHSKSRIMKGSVFPGGLSMSADVAQPHTLLANRAEARTQVPATTSVPWYIWAGAIAVTSASVGGQWDVSWHRSIGRDSFWTPAHMAIYACGVIAGIVGSYLVLTATYGRSSYASRLREVSVNIFGLRAPLGVFLAGWGGVAMLTSAPFDNWWHNAYGLDVKIISPPHALLILGIRAIDFGMLFLMLAAMNRASDAGDANYRNLRRLFLYLGGLVLGGQMFFIMEYTWDVALHRVVAYVCLAIAVPVVMATISQASRFRWAATTIAAIYAGSVIAYILILPLFPAQPKLGPVFYPVTHLV